MKGLVESTGTLVSRVSKVKIPFDPILSPETRLSQVKPPRSYPPLILEPDVFLREIGRYYFRVQRRPREGRVFGFYHYWTINGVTGRV